MGRPADGPERVERLEGSHEAKRRARVVLEVIAGKRSVNDACTELGIETTRFEVIREEALAAMVVALEPKAPGRPAKVISEEEKEIARLQEEVRELRAAVVTAHMREELSIALPLLGKRGKKGR